MKFFKRNIIKFFIAVFLPAMLSSCVFDSYEQLPGKAEDEGHFMILRVNALDGGITGDDIGDGREMVKSLRIIMLNDGAVELNRYITLGQGQEGINMANLDYVLTARTVEGSKKFYLLANEESVNDLMFKSEATLPETLPTNLHDYLESVTPDANNVSAGQDFENIINAIYFQPDYTADNSGNIYLPYSSYYDGYEVSEESPSNVLNPLQLHLVPVATKFMFQFVNYRLHTVEINNITVSSKNTENYLLARVNYPDYTKTFEGTEYYWVDWLAKVSEASHNNADFYDNTTFNEKYGWISNYDMPSKEVVEKAIFIDGTNVKEVPAGQPVEDSEDISPSTLVLGPFYAPESWNSYTYRDENSNQDVTIQRYGLTLGLHDTSSLSGHDPAFEDVAIDNLQALFRNTCVLIKVTMSEGPVEVYAEINPWTVKSANGWLVEGNAPSNNPF
ncbi:MAG: hypothetical protein J1E84_05370 [Muribaculaceae bacterium]|nr:hypothetical protein [Muribaculaceae bacterium]